MEHTAPDSTSRAGRANSANHVVAWVREYGYAAGAAILLGGFIVFTMAAAPEGSGRIDGAAGRLTGEVVRGAVHPFVDTLVVVGSPLVSSVLALMLAGALMMRGRRRVALLVAVAFVAVTGIELLLRVSIAVRTWQDVADVVLHPQRYDLIVGGYPSGHAARTALVWGAAAVSLPGRFVVAGLASAVVCSVLVALQRIDAGYHTGSDVLGGLMLGGGAALLIGALASRWSAAPASTGFSDW